MPRAVSVRSSAFIDSVHAPARSRAHPVTYGTRVAGDGGGRQRGPSASLGLSARITCPESPCPLRSVAEGGVRSPQTAHVVVTPRAPFHLLPLLSLFFPFFLFLPFLILPSSSSSSSSSSPCSSSLLPLPSLLHCHRHRGTSLMTDGVEYVLLFCRSHFFFTSDAKRPLSGAPSEANAWRVSLGCGLLRGSRGRGRGPCPPWAGPSRS